ncbi:MAG: ferredoxin/flavodoxin---NADP+ reductase [Actinomycetota bacterium]|jgi:thioredoxin reductase (NADPH)|nr:ferredoxin/flavodoxin---NADP+ reductase [Actinomycetota bacterium]
MTIETDILVVGAGPTGLFAAYYAGFRGLRVAVLDSLPEPGGQVNAMYPEKLIHDVAGFPAVRGRDLVASLLDQAAAFSPTYLLGQEAASLANGTDGRLHVTTGSGEEVVAKAIVLAGGIGTFTPRPLPVGENWVGRGVEYFVPQPADYAGLDVVVVGGGDSAVDWCLALQPVAKSVRLVHRRDAFRAHGSSVGRARELDIEFLTPYTVSALHGNGSLEAVEITRVKPRDDVRRLDCQAVVAALGFTADLGPLESWGVEMVDRHIVVDSRMATNVPRVYAAGDITEYPGKVRLIAVGFGEAATAVNNAAVAIDPESALFPGHSTDAAAA